MALSTGPGAVHHPVSQTRQQDGLVTPPCATPRRRRLWSGSSLDPEAPESVSPAAVSTQGELAQLICYPVHTKTLKNLVDGPSRDYIRSLIAAKEAERKMILQRFTSLKAELDGARQMLAKADKPPTLDRRKNNASSILYAKGYYRLEQEIIELEIHWANGGRGFAALDEEIEELWGELAVARGSDGVE